MKTKLLFGLFLVIGLLVLSGCAKETITQQTKYVCPDGTVVSDSLMCSDKEELPEEIVKCEVKEQVNENHIGLVSCIDNNPKDDIFEGGTNYYAKTNCGFISNNNESHPKTITELTVYCDSDDNCKIKEELIENCLETSQYHFCAKEADGLPHCIVAGG